MGEILNAFGVDWRLVVIQIFNFTLLLAALWYFLYTPILNILKERQGAIEKGVKDAEEAEKQLDEATDEKNSILKKAHTEAEKVAKRAAEHAHMKSIEIMATAGEKGGRLVDDAKKQGEVIKQEAQRESEKEIAKVAILAAEKILREQK